MKDCMTFIDDIQYLLRESSKDNPKYAYLAGLAMEEKGYRQFYVQAQFRCAAEWGYPVAQRWLGILGLCHLLLSKDCSFSEERYCQNYDEAFTWLEKAASRNDKIAAYILAKCRDLGIGMEANEAEANVEMKMLRPFLSNKEVNAVSLLLDYCMMDCNREAINSFYILRSSTPICDLKT